jgi:glutaredoxin
LYLNELKTITTSPSSLPPHAAFGRGGRHLQRAGDPPAQREGHGASQGRDRRDAAEDEIDLGEGDDVGYSFSGGHIKGRVSFFSRSGCRDCAAVRAFFRQSGLPYVEINLDVFSEHEAELASRAGGAARVPQIFLNEKLLGGLVVINSLRNSGEFECRVRDLAGRRCPDSAPRVPVYGFDDEAGGGREDDMVAIVRVLRTDC